MEHDTEKSVRDKTSDFVASAAERAERLKDKTADIAERAVVRTGEKWQETEPLRQRAGERLEKAADAVTAFGAEVKEGFKEGVARARRMPDRGDRDGEE